MTIPTIEFQDYSFHYHSRLAPSVEGVNLELSPGSFTVICGSSGSGKTTLIHSLAGLLSEEDGSSKGQILLKEEQTVVEPQAYLQAHPGQIGLIQQDVDSQLCAGTVAEEVAFGLENLGTDPSLIPAQTKRALDQVGLEVSLDHKTRELSGGQKQKLAIACVLAMKPKVIILDEAASMLDGKSLCSFQKTVELVWKKTRCTIICVDHDLTIWQELAQKIVVMQQAKIKATADFNQIYTFQNSICLKLDEAGVWYPRREDPGSNPKLNFSQGYAVNLRQINTKTDYSTTKSKEFETNDGKPNTKLNSSDLNISPPNQVSPTSSNSHNAISNHETETGTIGARAKVKADLPTVLRADNLTVGYTWETALLSNLNLELTATEPVCFIGNNGVGKTTLALTIAGIISKLKGDIVVRLANDVSRSDPYKWRASEVASTIPLVFQHPNYQFVKANVYDELAHSLKVASLNNSPATLPKNSNKTSDKCTQISTDIVKLEQDSTDFHKIYDILRHFRLDHLAKAHPNTLSGGEKKRLGLAVALITDPKILILDEPTFGQDKHTWQILVEALQERIASGLTLLAVSHDERFISCFDRVVNLDPYSLGQKPALSEAKPPLDKLQPAEISNNTNCGGEKNKNTISNDGTIDDLGFSKPVEPWSEFTQENTAQKNPRNTLKKPTIVSRCNELSLVFGVFLLTLPLIVTIDWVSASSALVLEFCLFSLVGVSLRRLFRILGIICLTLPLAVISMVFYGQSAQSVIYFSFGPINISQNSIILATGVGLRFAAFMLASLAIFPKVRLLYLADALIQILHLPARVVIAATSGLNLGFQLKQDWYILAEARRSRGIDDRFKIVAFFRGLLKLLTFSLIRAQNLALAMEARGFRPGMKRSYSRKSTLGYPDLLFFLACLLIPCLCLSLAVYTGRFSWFGIS